MKTSSSFAIGIFASILLVAGVVFAFQGNPERDTPSTANVVFDDGQQVITVTAKNGYGPRLTTAKPDTPTTLKVKTNGTFDCSSALVIPKLGINARLQPTGEYSVEIPPQPAGTTIDGLCSMGMYNFQIQFTQG